MSNKLSYKAEKKNSSFARDWRMWVMLTPFLVLFFIFTILPVLSSLVLSFFSYDMISIPKFIGIGNYSRMFLSDEVFSATVRNTLVFAVVTGPISYMLAFVLAWFINEFSPLVRSILSFLFYAPALVGNAFYIWQVAFSGDSYGYVNSLLLTVGLITEPINWFKDPAYNIIIISIVQLWMGMGVSFLANIAGLQNVDAELYEAGALDGIKSRWHELWYITLPSMKSILLFSAVMQIQSAFAISGIVQSLAGYPSVNNSVDTIVTYMTDLGTTKYEMGYASAVSVFLFVLMAFTRIIVGKLLNSTGK